MIEFVILVWGLSLFLYALLAGADFGAGIIELIPIGVPKEERSHLIGKAMGPVWEANHIWLILALVITFNGNLYGLKYGFYLGDNVGITSEVGQYELRNHGYINGQYWLVGPSMIYKIDDLLFKLDLGAGSSFDSQFGLMSKADISFNWLTKSGFNIGFGFGGMYLQVREFDGLSRSNQEVGIGWALNTGYLF